jgi:hypothetical protein
MAEKKVASKCVASSIVNQGKKSQAINKKVNYLLMSIDPTSWGPSFWSTLHWTAAAYPVNPTPTDKTFYKVFFENLQHTLPCTECREHYKQLLSQMPIDPFLVSGKQLRQWVTSLHNTVNSRTENAQRWTLIQVDQKYSPADPQDSTFVPAAGPIASSVLPVYTLPRNAQVRIPPAPVKVASVQRGLIHSMRQQQKIMNNNARTLGRIQKMVSNNRPTMRRAPFAAVNPGITSVEPKKKKGCGCNKKK